MSGHTLGRTFSSWHGNAKEDVDSKMNLYFLLDLANDWMCLLSLTAVQVNLSITYESGIEFQMET